VVRKTSCKDRNHRILRGVIAPHQDFFIFLQKNKKIKKSKKNLGDFDHDLKKSKNQKS
jgi:hypothetical protein